MRPVPPSIDKRNEVQRNLDRAVRDAHKEFGNEMSGFFLVAYGADIAEPVVFMQTDIKIECIKDYVSEILAMAIEQSSDAS